MNDSQYEPRHRHIAPEAPVDPPPDHYTGQDTGPYEEQGSAWQEPGFQEPGFQEPAPAAADDPAPYDPAAYDASSYDPSSYDAAPYDAAEVGPADDDVQETPFHDDVFVEEPHRRRSARSVLAALVALVVIVGAIAFGGTKAYHYAKDHLGGGSSGGDYAAADAHGSVDVTITPSESGTQMARDLKSHGVVKSVDAFVEAYNDNAKASKIAPGTYKLQLQMPAAAAIDALLDHTNLEQSKVLVREGLRATDIIKELEQQTKFSAKDFQKVLDNPSQIGLPASADGNPEGYLFPATYGFAPGTKPAAMLSQMVSTWQSQAKKLGLAGTTTIDGHHYSVQQIMTVASLVQEEGKTPDDMAKIARVIYNRVEHPGAQGQNGSLQIDATVDYGLGRPLTVGLTDADRRSNSPYNTYQHIGLPPGPIGNPGADAIEAAMNPADGDWYYYITVNLATGETKFAHTYAQFLQDKAEHDNYCQTQSASGCQ